MSLMWTLRPFAETAMFKYLDHIPPAMTILAVPVLDISLINLISPDTLSLLVVLHQPILNMPVLPALKMPHRLVLAP